jgi:hypothetical protein
MIRQENIRIVLGNKRFAGSSNKPISIQLPLDNSKRDIVDNQRSTVVDLQDISAQERNESSEFRLSGKIVNIFDNSISGKTTYVPFRNNLYYVNPQNSVLNGVWQGFPQYDEFNFIREKGVEGHLQLINKSATTYNWGVYTSYAFSSSTNQVMSYTNETFGVVNQNFMASDGIPYVIKNTTTLGRKTVLFYCATDHNLTLENHVMLSTPINGRKTFKVTRLGDGQTGTEKKVFGISNILFNPNDIVDGTYGNFKRIANIDNLRESTSKYYVRLHKIITGTKDTFIVNSGFERNGFPIRSKLEYSALTPNQQQRISVKDGARTYGFNINQDINIKNLKDNNNKPVRELFITIVNKGYFGYFNKPGNNSNTALDIGWEFNFLKNGIDTWWNHLQTTNKDNIFIDSYTKQSNTFYFNKELNKGDVIKGDFCEYNDIEQMEYVLSPLYHKYSYNPDLLNTDQPVPNGFAGIGIALANYFNSVIYPPGYFYRPHYSIPIRTYSNYIEDATNDALFQVPDYAFYSENDQKFYWRDIYTYDFIDGDGRGLNLPFTNGKHYVFKDILFLQHPVKRNTSLVVTDIITDPINDNCE